MKHDIPLTRDLVLIGGGHTHALVLRKWGMSPLPGVQLTLIDPGASAAYSGMLPGFVAGHYERQDLEIDLVRLARFAGARLITGPAVALDPIAKQVTVPGRPSVDYDVVSVDIGITSEMPGLPGFSDHGIPAKPLGRFADSWARLRGQDGPANVAVIGGGVAGVELSLAMAHGLKQTGRPAQITLIDRGRVVNGLNDAARTRLIAALGQAGVTLIEGATITRVTADAVMLEDGRQIASDFTTGAAGARAQPWLAETGLATHDGFLTVGPTLQSSDPDVFAVGDCAHLGWDPRPKAGVYAVRAAPVLYDNLKATLSGGKLRRFHPQKDYLKLVSLGEKRALAEKFGTARAGRILWQWKDWIDRRFMAKFATLAPMTPAPLPLQMANGAEEIVSAGPVCGGCGAKVGPGALHTALKALPAPERDDVTPLPGDDAAVLQIGTARQVISTDHLRAVTDDPVQMARIAAIHALGDIWAMGADPHAALATIILPRMSPGLQARRVAEITQAATKVLTSAGAALVGGHTSQGADLTIGFTVTGLVTGNPITLQGAQPGDALILTKPIGTGTILAAEMRGQARGADVLTCLASMTQPQSDAARVLRDAHAMTDVTGFGLAGHLSALCAASGVGAQLDLPAIPVLPGALDLAQSGIRSSLYQDNVAGAEPVTGETGVIGALLFDPQTAGGLLAAVPAAEADGIVSALRDAGYQAARIGQITAKMGISVA